MTTAVTEPRRAIVDLLPGYLQRRRAGFKGTPEMQAVVALPEYMLLRALAMELGTDRARTYAELFHDLFNPYNTIRPGFEQLMAQLVAKGLIGQEDGRYRLTEQGQTLVAHGEAAANAYAAGRIALPTADRTRLVEILEALAERLWTAPEPAAKPHQARVLRLNAIVADATLHTRLDQVIYGLWMARDDAHNAAWRAAGFDGPTFDLLSQIWSGAATTLDDLYARLKDNQRPEDIEHGVERLMAHNYLTRAGDQLALTPRGRATRNAIERATDRTYFAAWTLHPNDAPWLETTLRRVVQGFE